MVLKSLETALVLRICAPDMTGFGGFQWPDEVGGLVEAPDWAPSSRTGNGLHGWLFGHGDYSCSPRAFAPGAKWLVVEVFEADLIRLSGKVKFPRCTIKFIGGRCLATQYLLDNEPRAASGAVIGASLEVGDHATCQVGALGRATAGDNSIAIAGYLGTAAAGEWGTATAGDLGIASVGRYGTATAGDKGVAIAGEKGTAIAGEHGVAAAGHGGILCIRYLDAVAERYRVATACVGEGEIQPGARYSLNSAGLFIEARPSAAEEARALVTP